MRKIICLILAGLMIFALCACQNTDGAIGGTDTSIIESTHESSEPTESTEPSENSSVVESSSEAVSSSQPAPSNPTPVQPVTPKPTYLANFIGKTVADVKTSFGTNCTFDGFAGSSVIYYPNAYFFFVLDAYYVSPPDNAKVVYAFSTASHRILLDSLHGSMTYPEVKAAAGSAVTTAPEYWYNAMDDIWQYSLEFTYKGYSFYYSWYDDPNTNKCVEAYARAPIF